ncbi:MAG: SufD family Fe-S cluster assembly protein [Gammaproteobacteria bacterium]|nr:SufD family Fe-S cluster assembly protein [Gammaproteobacteria bacterium]
MSALERLLGEFAALAASDAGMDGAGRRDTGADAAAAALRAQGLPTRRDENWHYADLRALEGIRQFRAAPPAQRTADAQLPEPLEGHARLVYIDGVLAGGSPLPASPALTRLPVAAVAASPPADPSGEFAGDARMGLVARMFAPEPLALRVTGSAALEIVHLASSTAANCHSHVRIELDAGASLSLVERQLGFGALVAEHLPPAALHCSNLELRLGAGAQLRHTRLQQAAGHALRFNTLSAELGAQAVYQLCQLAAGDGSERTTAQFRLQGRAASLRIAALAAARGAQSADSQFSIVHAAPATRSEQLFRGIASDRAQVSCSADVRAEATAPGARVQQSLRGLIDGPGAAVNLRPRLTINTDDIQAQHGATTGRLDENLLFYLLARGLEPATARSLLKWALLGEVFTAVEPAPLRRAAERAVAVQLRDATATELLQ